MKNNGLFIVFEGIDGAGKTSQLLRTKEYLEQKGYTVRTTREPGGTAIGEKIRDLLLDPANGEMNDRCELLLYGASRSQHVAEVIAPALERGEAVLCDRFSLSTVAYQGYGRGLDLERLCGINDVAVAGVYPHLTVILDVDEKVSAERVSVSRGQPKDRLEQEKSDFFRRVRHGFLTEGQKDPAAVIIDGSQSEAEVFQSICKELEKLL